MIKNIGFEWWEQDKYYSKTIGGGKYLVFALVDNNFVKLNGCFSQSSKNKLLSYIIMELM